VKSALLVDFDNIYGALEAANPGDGIRFVEKVANWQLWFEDGAFAERQRRRRWLARRVYWNTPFQRFRRDFEAAGFEAFTCAPITHYKIEAGKSTADIVMTMDAMELSRKFNSLDEFILLTMDSDFVPVVNRLRLAGKRVVMAGNERNRTLRMFEEHADAAVHVSALQSALDYKRATRLWYKLQSAPPVIPEVPREEGRNSAFIERLRKDIKEERKEAEVAAAAASSAERGPSRRARYKPEQLKGQKEAADTVERLGKRLPDQPIGRQKIVQVLRKIEGFTFEGASGKSWFGCRSYRGLMLRIGEINPAIKVTPGPDRSVVVVYRAPIEAPAEVPAENLGEDA
jgi:hypothetical protein